MDNIQVIQGDITKVAAEAIVNAANGSLLGGGGVDGAIHRAGGPKIMAECRKIGGCPTGEAVITTAGNLPSKKVIHTVGPIWNGGNNYEEQLLKNSYVNSLNLAVENDLTSIAFPNISTGVYGFPKKLAAEIAVNTVREFLIDAKNSMKIVFVCFDDENYAIYNKLIK